MVTLKEEQRRPTRRGGLFALLGNLLMTGGLLLTVAVGALYGYSLYEERQFQQESELRRQAFEQERAALEQVRREEEERAEQERVALESRERERVEAERAAELEAELPSFERRPAPVAAPSPAKPALVSPARRIIIPSIGVDSEIVEAAIRNGEWTVPRFVVGHLQGTGHPNQPGNAVYSGHLQSVIAGNVFAELGRLRAGDQIYLLTAEGQYLYEIKETRTVANTDLSVVQPTPDSTVTLITCTGPWDFATRDYLQRTIVVAKLFRDAPPARLAIQPR